jgi:hypothetical protein
MKLNRKIYLLLLLFLLLAMVGHPQLETSAQSLFVNISDEEFDPGEWSVTVEATGEASHTVHQEIAGGNPGAFRSMLHALPPVPPGELAEIAVTHLYLADSYNPYIQGAIDYIIYQEDNILLNLPWPEAFSTTQVVVEQDGHLFRTNTTDLRFIANTTWETSQLFFLDAEDFFAADGSGDHPDFSSAGGVIRFGYTRHNSRTNTLPAVDPNTDLVIEHGIDNWQVQIRSEGLGPGNSPPVANNDLAIVRVGESVSIPVLANDSDPDGDELIVSSVDDPSDGINFHYYSGIFYQNDGSDYDPTDEFMYTVEEDLFSAAGKTDTANVLILIDCGCTTKCLSLKESVSHRPPFYTFLGMLASWIFPSFDLFQGDEIDLALVYRVRDEVMKPTPDGWRYVDMYYNTTPEILKILLVDNPDLGDDAVATVELWQDNLRNLVDGDGSAKITQAQVDAIDSFLTALSAAASPELQQIIADERARLGSLDDYVGLSVEDAKRKAIGEPVIYMPMLTR